MLQQCSPKRVRSLMGSNVDRAPPIPRHQASSYEMQHFATWVKGLPSANAAETHQCPRSHAQAEKLIVIGDKQDEVEADPRLLTFIHVLRRQLEVLNQAMRLASSHLGHSLTNLIVKWIVALRVPSLTDSGGIHGETNMRLRHSVWSKVPSRQLWEVPMPRLVLI